METSEIKKISKKTFESLEKAKNFLEKDYEISYGKYENLELKKAIDDKTPFFIENHFIIGYQPDGTFIDSNDDIVPIERMVKAVIIEDIKAPEEIEKTGDLFAIVGKNEWGSISEFQSIIGNLRVGEIYLPPHSAVFNFLNPTNKESMEKIVSCLDGVNINIYQQENYIDNAIHEIGHLFWRDCTKYDEKKKFKEHFDYLKPNALYNFDWEKKDEEEVFCTIYKWYIKSILLNPSFYNILEHEDKQGLELLQGIFDRIAKDKLINDIWELKKDDLLNYLNPKFDKTTGRKFVKKGLFDEIKDIELPDSVLNDVDRFQGGTVFVRLNKACVPVQGNKIDWEEMEKARFTKYSDKKPDGKGGWIYKYPEDVKKKVKKY